MRVVLGVVLKSLKKALLLRQNPRPENAAEQVGATRFRPVVVEIIDLKQ